MLKRKHKKNVVIKVGKRVTVSFDLETGEPKINGKMIDIKKMFFKEIGRIPFNDEELVRFIFWTQVKAAYEAGFGDNMPELPNDKLSPPPFSLRK